MNQHSLVVFQGAKRVPPLAEHLLQNFELLHPPRAWVLRRLSQSGSPLDTIYRSIPVKSMKGAYKRTVSYQNLKTWNSSLCWAARRDCSGFGLRGCLLSKENLYYVAILRSSDTTHHHPKEGTAEIPTLSFNCKGDWLVSNQPSPAPACGRRNFT